MSSRSSRSSSRADSNKPARSRNTAVRSGTGTPVRSHGRPVQRRRIPIWVWAAGVLAVVVLVGGGVALLRPGGGSADLSAVQQYSNLSRDHVIQNVTYPQ